MRKFLTGGLTAAALLVAGVPAAEAATVCREARVAGVYVVLACVQETTQTNVSGTTAAPYVRIDCYVDTSSAPEPCQYLNLEFDVNRTGFVPAASPPPVIVDPATGSVGIGAGSLGTLYVAGLVFPVSIGGTCVGDPSVC